MFTQALAESLEETSFLDDSSDIQAFLDSMELKTLPQKGDGNCFFRTLASILGLDPDECHEWLRQVVAAYMVRCGFDIYSVWSVSFILL